MRLPINGASTALVLILAPVTGFAAHAEINAGGPSDLRRDPPILHGMREPAALKGTETSGKACCPGEDHTVQQPRRGDQSATYADNQKDDVAPLATTGLGQSIPAAKDISHHPMWLIYGFERDGVRYFQVNDLAGQVQLIVGMIGGTFWALPAGHGNVTFSPADEVPLNHSTMNWVEVYRDPEFSLNVHGAGENAIWLVEQASY